MDHPRGNPVHSFAMLSCGVDLKEFEKERRVDCHHPREGFAVEIEVPVNGEIEIATLLHNLEL